jgi:phage gp46-like protein
MSDVLLRQSNDGGEITLENGLVLMSEGLETAAYLSLFGGNQDDAGDTASARLQWWGNLDEVEPARTYRSETQYLLKSLAAVPRNLRRVEQAASRDLAWMLTAGVATRIDVASTIPALNRIALEITIVTPTTTVQLVFG